MANPEENKARLETLLRELKKLHGETRDSLEALAEDIEDNAIINALDTFSGLSSDLFDMAAKIDSVLSDLGCDGM